ncbi:MAG: zinc ribbon domain-containing protein [Candidatus Neomarinimicrobiota bacterium]
MDAILAPIILFLIFISTTYYVLVPFLSKKVVAIGEEEATRNTALELRKVNLYKQIREAEFERAIGRINEEDFDRIRSDLITEVAEVIQQLEGPPGRQAPGGSSRTAAGVSECPSCGAAVSPGDRFCSSCGRGLLN